MKQKQADPPFSDMGARIKEARCAIDGANMSKQIEMQAALGLLNPTYGNYERGSRKMPPHIMEKFSELTGYSSDYIYFGKLPKKNIERLAASDGTLTKRTAALSRDNSFLGNLNKEELALIDAAIKFIRKASDAEKEMLKRAIGMK